jgi:hypothetical protein
MASRSRYSGDRRKWRSPLGTPPFLPEHYYPTDSRQSEQQPHRSLHPLDRSHAWRLACAHPSTALRPVRGGLTMNLATNRRAKRRDRTDVYMCHLDHLLQLPWAYSPMAGLFGPLRFDILPRCVQPVHRCTIVRSVRRDYSSRRKGIRTHPCPRPASASQRRDSDRDASPSIVSLRPSRDIRISAFDRFDEILYLVENAPDLTLTDSVRCYIHVASSRNLRHRCMRSVDSDSSHSFCIFVCASSSASHSRALAWPSSAARVERSEALLCNGLSTA